MSERARPLPPLRLRGREFAWGSRTYVMGVINATPDSFSGDGIVHDPAAAVRRAQTFAAAGCDLIDIGGESTRPGHAPVPEAEELARVLPIIKAIRAAVDLPISVDTFKPEVARAALAAGADMVNCVWGAVKEVVEAAAQSGAAFVVMHNRSAGDYAADCVTEVIGSLERAAREVRELGIATDRIIVDPGIGFGKTADDNVQILQRLGELVERLPYPLLVGTSRKSFIGKISGLPVESRTYGTAATVALAVAGGADLVRLHDVVELMAVVDVSDAICRHGTALSRNEPSAFSQVRPNA